MDNVQKHNICTDVSSSQTFDSYSDKIYLLQNHRIGVINSSTLGFDLRNLKRVSTKK
jgi:hypothetical protein